jgi:glycosyltransferase involved in cell wall biosynthesis
VTRFHGHDLYRERKGSGWQPFRKLIGDFADRLIFACQAGKDYFEQNWGFAKKTRLHYLGCSESQVCPHGESATLRVVSCSNLIELKRVDLLIRAMSLLPGDVSVRWDHFGDGEEADKLKQLAGQMLGENVTWNFHGHVANHLLRQRFYQLDPDVFVTTSSTEGGVPVSIQEALSVGIPAIGTAVGGVPEAVVPGKTGFLLDQNPSAQEVTEVLLRFVALSPQEKAALQKGALELWGTSFCADRNAQNVMRELHEIFGE